LTAADHTNTRVLVVEDDALLALNMARQLTDAGLAVVGPATSVNKALRLIRENGFEVAVLDINVGNQTAEPVARELRALGKPFVVHSGYSSEQHPPEFKGAPVLSKPVRPGVLVAMLLRCRDDDVSISTCRTD